MVQTRSTTKRIESGIPLRDDGGVTEAISVEHPTNSASVSTLVKQRRGGTAAPRKRLREKPSEICQLNLDVLFVIAAYVHPIDLLNLARTCKSLRRLLMDKCSVFIWKAARHQVIDLPDCPADLTEPEYANLVFYARCHDCGKYAKNVLWKMRRRFCPDCRIKRLCSISSCHEVIRRNNVLASEHITLEGETTVCVDREQMESFMHGYQRFTDKEQFLIDKEKEYAAIYEHAFQCEFWQRSKASERKVELDMRRRKRSDCIFERLKQLGYQKEVTYFHTHAIKRSCKSLFRKSKLLTDKEWNQIWPELVETMNNFRSLRLEQSVYYFRRASLSFEYANYVRCPPPNSPGFDLFPHVVDLAGFVPFRDIIRAPEGIQMNDKPFESAFAQLPGLINEWRKTLDAEVAKLVTFRLPFESTSDDRAVTSDGEPFQAATDKLRLACALFHGGTGGTKGLFTHPEVFYTSMHDCRYPSHENLERTGSIWDRYGIEWIAEAPYVVRACGLDPKVATADDMDRRNARLICLTCKTPRVRRWRDAVYHSYLGHLGRERSEYPQWQVVIDEHTATIEAAEQSLLTKGWIQTWSRCLLCLPCVGGVYTNVKTHLKEVHNVEEADVQQGVHYAPLGMPHELCSVEMVEEGGEVTFREPNYFEPCRWLGPRMLRGT